MSEHTNGPWAVRGPTGFRNQMAIDPCIATVYGDQKTGELKANARLIAAAPELLEALEALLTAMGDGNGNGVDGVYGNWPEWSPYRELDAAVAAVKKARDGGACS